MHRYIPRLHIIEALDSYSMRTGPLSTFIFEETAFIAVTAYQNDQVCIMKKLKCTCILLLLFFRLLN